MPELVAQIGGVRIAPLLMNASGPNCTTLVQLAALAQSAAGAIVTKSMTREPRAGNAEPRYRDLPFGSINSMGLPNLGYLEYCRLLPGLRELGKPVVASIAGFSLDDYVTIVQATSEAGFDLIEVNLSCPNIAGEPQVGYDFVHSEEVLAAVRAVCRRPLGVKLPPYFDPVHHERMAAIVNRSGVDFLTLINSVGNALVIDADSETPVIHPRGGFGGLGGEYVKPVALANVRAFYTLTGGAIPIIGVGGAYTGRDVFEFLLAGASAVQLGTAYMQEGTGIYARVAAELAALLAAKGYANATDAVGKLKPLPAAEPAATG
ncbi:MAG TPA: dihydroorotate oxidase [Dehalococcoidia bacterium]|jgi:dihydroorotate dehydrogenase (fumarate)